RYLAMQLLVQGHEDSSQATFGVGAEDAEPLALAGGGADAVGGGALGVAVRLGRVRGELRQGAAEVRVADPGEALLGGATGGEGGQALLEVAAVLLEVEGGQGLEGGPLGVVEVTAADQEIGKQSILGAAPGLEGGDELALIDQPVLQGEQAEEQIALG